jgi:hypothetical protein
MTKPTPTPDEITLGNLIKTAYPWAKYIRMDETNAKVMSVWAFAKEPKLGDGQWHSERFSLTADLFDEVREIPNMVQYLRNQDCSTWGLNLTDGIMRA